jgi:meso-butanediol dehydrogenase / (S,S)-butanediol dehydrogenase / diacetyl reductase
MSKSGEFKDKVVLVTGSGRGIGRGIALAFAREGAAVAVNGLNAERCRAVCREVEEAGGKGLAAPGDVSDTAAVSGIFAKLVDGFGKIDILVNNAGICYVAEIVDTTDEQWDRTMAVNTRSMFLCSREAVRLMKKTGKGKIINLASQLGKTGAPYYTHYCASKFAIVGFTQALGREVAKLGINVNAVCPGPVDTDMTAGEIVVLERLTGKSKDAIRKELTDSVPLGRLEYPEDVANLVLFLASDKAGYMTGQAINITGGLEVH